LSIAALIQAQISSNFNCNYTGMHISNWHPNYLIRNISNQFLMPFVTEFLFMHPLLILQQVLVSGVQMAVMFPV
jgi:hypothetical protein